MTRPSAVRIGWGVRHLYLQRPSYLSTHFFEYLKLMLQTILIIIRPLFLASDNYASVVTYFPALHLGS